MSLDVAFYLLGIGGIGGFFVGYIFKKIAKTVAIAGGFFLLVLIALDYIGAFSINYGGIAEFISKLFDPTQAVEVLMPLITNFPLAIIFTAGFLVGLRKG